MPLSQIINVSMLKKRKVSAINAETAIGLKLKNVTMETQMITMVVQMNAISTLAGPVMMDLMSLFLTLPSKMTTQQLQSASNVMTAFSKQESNVTMEVMIQMAVSLLVELTKAILVTLDLILLE